MALHALHLCSGYGGFELALRSWGVRTVCHVERDARAAATLVARMEAAQLDRAPCWDDLCTFDGRAWRGVVDICTAGFPCQPFSAAGKRLGLEDERWIWPDIARIIGEVVPRFVFLENVPGLIRRGLPNVLSDLAALGFDAEWGCLPASAVGAPHKRERVWIVAHRVRSGRERETGGEWGLPIAAEGCGDVGYAAGARYPEVAGSRVSSAAQVWPGSGSSVGAERASQDVDGAYRGSAHAWPPGRGDSAGWAEWVAAGNAEPVVRGGVDGATGRMVGGIELAERLHLLGNGLVPQCATEAIRQLLDRANVLLTDGA